MSTDRATHDAAQLLANIKAWYPGIDTVQLLLALILLELRYPRRHEMLRACDEEDVSIKPFPTGTRDWRQP